MGWKKSVVTLEILKKEARYGDAVWTAKNNEKWVHHRRWKLRLCPTIPKNTPTKEGQNKPENAKTDLKPFLTILGTSQRANSD